MTHLYNGLPINVSDSFQDSTSYSYDNNQRLGPLLPFLTGFVIGAPFWGRPYPPAPYPYPYPYPYPVPYYGPRPFYPPYRPPYYYR